MNINKKASTLVVINIITTVEFDDDRSFIGYQIYHTSDPYGNVTRDNYQPCLDRCVKANSKMNWNPLMPLTSLHFTSLCSWIVSEPSKDTSSFIGNLLPYTKYAFYVRTMTISSEKRNYQSDIIRFQTMPTKPTDVRRISARSTDSSKIVSMIRV